MTVLEIGDSNPAGTYVITDTNLDPEGLRVTVRELMGERGLSRRDLAAMRRLARRACPTADSTRLLRSWFSGGCSHATFLVTGGAA